MTVLDRLAARRLILVTGKGGTGKSLVAAALGRILAARGQAVHLLEADPRESLYRLLGIEPAGGAVVEAGPRLRLENVDLSKVADGLVLESVPIEFIARRVIASPVYRHFAAGAPGLKELCLLGHAYNLLERPGFAGTRRGRKADVVILDAPATGHAVALLDAPRLVSEVIEHGPVGRLVTDLAAYLADRERCGTVVVAIAEEMPILESLQLIAVLRDRFHAQPDVVVLNGLYPPTRKAATKGDDPALALARRRRVAQEREAERLRKAWSGPLVEIPLIAAEGGPALLADVETILTKALGETP
jgi:anion-transporting  ArsA/GET3 family ATPase